MLLKGRIHLIFEIKEKVCFEKLSKLRYSETYTLWYCSISNNDHNGNDNETEYIAEYIESKFNKRFK